MSATEGPFDARSQQKPKFGVRIGRGVVTYWNQQPLLTREDAEATREAILNFTGERGEIEEVIVL